MKKINFAQDNLTESEMAFTNALFIREFGHIHDANNLKSILDFKIFELSQTIRKAERSIPLMDMKIQEIRKIQNRIESEMPESIEGKEVIEYLQRQINEVDHFDLFNEEWNKKYLVFLEGKRNSLLKNTPHLSTSARYNQLKELGLFETSQWNGNNRSTDEKANLLAQILYCDVDTARHLINGNRKYQSKKPKG